MHRDVTYVTTALQAGASGFVLKNSAGSELLTAIREAMAGRIYVTPPLADRLAQISAETCSENQADLPTLTLRQRQVLQLFAEGRSAKQVAAALHISPRTAEKHKENIMAMLQVTTIAELVQYAARHGIIPD
jgi:DNA-binding NarL/FixJ family response regulator